MPYVHYDFTKIHIWRFRDLAFGQNWMNMPLSNNKSNTKKFPDFLKYEIIFT